MMIPITPEAENITQPQQENLTGEVKQKPEEPVIEEKPDAKEETPSEKNSTDATTDVSNSNKTEGQEQSNN